MLVQIQSESLIFYCPGGEIGKHNEFKPRFLRVRIPIWIQKYALMSKLVKLVVLETMENYDTLPVRFRLGVLNIKIGMYFNWLEYHPDKVKVMGSSPIIPTKYGELVELVR